MSLDSRDVAAAAISAAVGSVFSFALSMVYLGFIAASADLGVDAGEPLWAVLLSALSVSLFFVHALAASVAAFTLGLGWHALAKRNRWSAWWGYALLGLIFGAFVGVFVFQWNMPLLARIRDAALVDFSVEPSVAAAIGGLTGVVMALVLRSVAKSGRKSMPQSLRDPAWERLTRR